MNAGAFHISQGTGSNLVPLRAVGGTVEIPSARAPAKAAVTSCVNAIIPSLPAPLSLKHGPLLVTVETWSDDSVVARLPVVGLYGEGESDTSALDGLRGEIFAFVADLVELQKDGGVLAGPLKEQWDDISALVDSSGLSA